MHTNDTAPRRRLTDILNGGADTLRTQWENTEAADDFRPLPAGTYEAHLQSVELFQARTGTPGVKIRFCVADGEQTGRMLWHDLWLTPAALPQTKRDCLKLGLDSLDKLENATIAPGRIRCRVRVALRSADDGTPYNRIRGFDVLGIDEPARDAFAPTDGDGAEKPADGGAGDASFAFGASVKSSDADSGAKPEGGDDGRR